MGFISVQANQVYYETVGQGEPLLMVMGLGGNSQVWAPIRRHLASRYCLVMYDMQGTGRSSTSTEAISLDSLIEEIEAVRSHLGLEQVRGLGYSFGATVLLNYASRYPQRLKSISLVSGLYEISAYNQKFFEVQARLAEVLDRRDYMKQIIFWLLSEQFFQQNPEFFDRIIFMLEQSPQAHQSFEGWKKFSTAFKPDYRQELSNLSCPVQIIHGSADKVSPASTVLRESRLVRECQVNLVENGGHMLTWDKPEATVELLLKFFSQN